MSKYCTSVLLLALVVIVMGCASLRSAEFTYNEVAIVNQTGLQIREVSVVATASGRMFGCGNIAPGGICANKFPPRSYTGSPLQVDWRIGDGKRSSKVIELTRPPGFVAQLPMRGVLIIDAQGQVLAYLQQDPPGSHR